MTRITTRPHHRTLRERLASDLKFAEEYLTAAFHGGDLDVLEIALNDVLAAVVTMPRTTSPQEPKSHD